MPKKIPTLPEGFQVKEGIAWGSRHEGLLEISIWNMKKKNSITSGSQNQIGKIVTGAQKDENVKVILVHGGLSFCSGNDLSKLADSTPRTEEEKNDLMSEGVEYHMVRNLRVLNRNVKPIVCLVRGHSIGIGFTMTSLFDFIYCSPDATFSTPFMKSCQSPEGTSTYSFVQQFGLRKANEILLLDKPITAQEAVQNGYANGIIEGLDDEHWPDITKIPAIPKLLATDYRTLVNCKELLNAAKDNARIEETASREAVALVDSWKDPDFPPKLMKFMASVMSAGKKKKQPQPKL